MAGGLPSVASGSADSGTGLPGRVEAPVVGGEAEATQDKLEAVAFRDRADSALLGDSNTSAWAFRWEPPELVGLACLTVLTFLWAPLQPMPGGAMVAISEGNSDASEATEPVLFTASKAVRIPAGSFRMGSPEDEDGRDSEETQHQVTVTRDFLMQMTEVTQGQWRALMGNNPANFQADDRRPVEQVNLYEACAYANALSTRDGLPLA